MSSRSGLRHSALLLIALTCLFAGCSDGSTPSPSESEPPAMGIPTPLTKVKLALNWFPEAEHGGFYAAQTQGFYQEEGLDVEIVPGGPDAPVVQNVALGRMEFGVSNADRILIFRNQDADVVSLMAPLQDSPRCIMVHESSGITSLEDLKDVTLAMSDGAAFSTFLRKKLPLENVRIVRVPGNVAQFLEDKNFAQQGYVFSEPFVAREQGGDPLALMVSKLGFNPYTSTLFARGQLLKDQPDLAAKMVRASLRGWRHYLQDPEETNAHIHQLNPEMGLDVLAYGAKTLKDLCLPGGMSEDELGTMTPERWQTLAEQMVEIEVIDSKTRPEDAYSLEFLDVQEARAAR